MKRIAADAGVHIYDPDATHFLFANSHCLMLGADATGGKAMIQLPAVATVVDAMSDEPTGEGVDHFRVLLRPKEVRIFSLH